MYTHICVLALGVSSDYETCVRWTGQRLTRGAFGARLLDKMDGAMADEGRLRRKIVG